MKLIQLILIISTIICNEIVAEIVLSDEQKVCILDTSSGEENAENENTELEGESEVEFVNEYDHSLCFYDQDLEATLGKDISNITNPFLEIHSPPPEQ